MFKRFFLIIAAIALTSSATARANFLSGTTTPPADLGADGDHYLNIATGTLSKRTSGTWSAIQSRIVARGDRGITGQRGVAGPIGPAGPGLRVFPNTPTRTSASPQYFGQLCLQSDTNSLWRGTAETPGAWQLIPTQGPEGAPGILPFANYPALSAATPGFIGQLAIDTAASTLYRATATTQGAWATLAIGNPIYVQAAGSAITTFSASGQLQDGRLFFFTNSTGNGNSTTFTDTQNDIELSVGDLTAKLCVIVGEHPQVLTTINL
jgi:hypothetical protein